MNCFSLEMLSRLSELLLANDHDTKLKLVMLKANGKAFCAGGDMTHLPATARHLNNGDERLFIKDSVALYNLIFLLATHSTPQLSVINGIAMGRGAVIFSASRFRILTENSKICFPETAIGTFPDSGASYLLSRLPGFFGEYLALTGARLDGPEMLALGPATHFVPATKSALLEEALSCKVALAKNGTSISDLIKYISAPIDKYLIQPSLEERGSALHKMDVIGNCFSRTVEEIVSALEKEATFLKDDPWIYSTIRSLNKASPMNLKISLRLIREGRSQGLGECLAREHRIAYHVARGTISRDFIEGCTRLLWDKNKIPQWEPSKLELVTDQRLDLYFSELGDSEEVEELKLPARPNLHIIASFDDVYVRRLRTILMQACSPAYI